MTRVAGIDCGTNSIRLLVADVTDDGRLTDVVRRMEVVRLGEGVDRTGRISPEAMARTLTRTREYAQICREHAVERIRFAATSASRDASNRAEFVAGVREAIGVEPEVISGTEEAGLSFTGATAGLAAVHPAPHLVVDIGGGSTEFVLGSGRVEAAASFDIGCVRLTERHSLDDDAKPAQWDAAASDVASVLTRAAEAVPLERAVTLIGVAGTVTTVIAHALGLERYDPDVLHGATLTPARISAACAELIAMPRAERAALPYMHPGRVDVIGAGALIWRAVVEAVTAGRDGVEVVASEHDILDGLALSAHRALRVG